MTNGWNGTSELTLPERVNNQGGGDILYHAANPEYGSKADSMPLSRPHPYSRHEPIRVHEPGEQGERFQGRDYRCTNRHRRPYAQEKIRFGVAAIPVEDHE